MNALEKVRTITEAMSVKSKLKQTNNNNNSVYHTWLLLFKVVL